MKLFIAACAILISSAAHAETNTVSVVDFAGVPKGTKCAANAPKAKSIKVRVKRKETKVMVKGDARGARFFCDLPDGSRLQALVPKVIPDGAEDAQFQVNKDGSGVVIIMHKGKLHLVNVRNAVKRTR